MNSSCVGWTWGGTKVLGAVHFGDAAGVPHKIDSVLMGHAIPECEAGAAQITLARYTHALPEDIERARAKLAAYLAEAQSQQIEAAGR